MGKIRRNVRVEVSPDGLGGNERLYVYFDRRKPPHKFEVVIADSNGQNERLIGGSYWDSSCSAEEAVKGIWHSDEEISRSIEEGATRAAELRERHPEWYAPREEDGEAVFLDVEALRREFGDEKIRVVVCWEPDADIEDHVDSADDCEPWESVREFTIDEVEGSLSDDRLFVRNFVNGKYGFFHISKISVTVRGEMRLVEPYDDMELDKELTLTALNGWLNES